MTVNLSHVLRVTANRRGALQSETDQIKTGADLGRPLPSVRRELLILAGVVVGLGERHGLLGHIYRITSSISLCGAQLN
jgi:hypothetical protein